MKEAPTTTAAVAGSACRIVGSALPSDPDKAKITTERGKRSLECEWMDLRALTQYAAVSERTVREWIHRASSPLPAVRVEGKILISRAKFNAWLESHPVTPANSVDINGIVDDVMSSLTEAQ